jgi:NTP pyrophosphatase (non-canonical NTP hydrolase)
MISLRKYQEFVEALASPNSTVTNKDRMIVSAIGLTGEAGEVSEIVKKHLYHEGPLDVDEVKNEIGDIMWYVAFACNTFGLDLQDVIETNVDKLKDRYPGGKFSVEDHLKKEGSKDDQ